MRFSDFSTCLIVLFLATAPCAGEDRLPSGDEATFAPTLEPWLSWTPAFPAISLSDPLMESIRITSPFGPRQLFGRSHPFHAGVDFAAHFGTPVQATADGWVTRAGPAGSYGNMIELAHGGGLITRYAHLSRILVVPGSHVRQGQEIGLSGSTGRSTGAHLHYEVRQDGQGIDPWSFPGSHVFETQRIATFAGPIPRWDSWNVDVPDRLPSASSDRTTDQAAAETDSSRAARSAR